MGNSNMAFYYNTGAILIIDHLYLLLAGLLVVESPILLSDSIWIKTTSRFDHSIDGDSSHVNAILFEFLTQADTKATHRCLPNS